MALACASMLLIVFAGCGNESAKDETIPTANETSPTGGTRDDLFSGLPDDGNVIVLPEIPVDGFEEDNIQEEPTATESVSDKPVAQSGGGNELPEISADSWNDENLDGSTTPTVTEPRETDTTESPVSDGQNKLPGIPTGDDEQEKNTSTKESNSTENPQNDGGNDLPAVGSDEEW